MKNWLAPLLLLIASCSSGAPAPTPDFEPILGAEDQRQADAPALQTAVHSDVPALRARAATAYGRIAKPAGVAPLLALLHDSDATVLAAASFALGQLAWQDAALAGRDQEVVTALAPLLRHGDATVRRYAVEAVGKLAGAGAPALVAPLLKDPAAAVRAEAALALFRAPYILQQRDATAQPAPLAMDALQALRGLASDADPAVRRAVAYRFSRFADAGFSDLLPQLVKDADLWARLFAVNALKRSADPSAPNLQALVQATGDGAYEVRLAAVQALIAIKHPETVPDSLATDPSAHVRAALADAYAPRSPGDETVLQKLWADPSPEVRAEALLALAGWRKAGAAALINTALGDPSFVLRVAAVDAAASLGAGAEDVYMRAIQDPDEHVRAETLVQLGLDLGAWSFSAIQAALSAPGLAERGSAAGSLAQRTEPARLDVAWAAIQASSGRRWRDIRVSLVDALASVQGAQSTAYLRMALQDPEAEVVNEALSALMSRGEKGLPAPPPPIVTYSPYLKDRFSQNPRVLFHTTRGDFQVECFADQAPVHVANLVGLVKQGYYDGLLWHRVVPNFVIQGGDKEGSGWGDDGYSLRAEINPVRFERGALGMPRSQDFDSGGSQVFANHVPTPHLDGQYTVFGQVREGLEVIDLIEVGDTILKASVLP